MTSDVVELTQQLIRIDSVNPVLAPGGAGESEIAAFAADWLAQRGFEVALLDQNPGRPSVLAISPGTGRGHADGGVVQNSTVSVDIADGHARSVMLNGHLDTVSLTGYAGDGRNPVVRDGRLYGRGSYDMKAGVAAIMVAAAAAASRQHSGDIVVALVADEEYASAGTEEVLRQVVTDTAIVVEPSGTDIVVAHRGFAWAEIVIEGRAAHGSRHDLGIDAIVKAGRFLVELGALGRRLTDGPRHELLGTGSVHASVIAGGIEASTYPDRCTITVERRTVAGEDAASFEQELRAILDVIARADPDFSYRLAITEHRGVFAAAEHSRVVTVLQRAYEDVTGGPAIVRGEPFWTDCALLADSGIDTVLFGVDGAGAHAAEEWVDIDSLHLVTRTLETAISRLVEWEQRGRSAALALRAAGHSEPHAATCREPRARCRPGRETRRLWGRCRA